MKVPRHHLSTLMATLLCLALCVNGQETPDARATARQLASEANDEAARLEEREEALRKLKEAARLFQMAGENVEAARVLNRVGRLQLSLYAARDALDSHTKALDLLRLMPDPEVRVDNLNGLGAAQMALKENKDQGERALKESLDIAVEIGYIPGQAQALLTLGESENLRNHAVALATAQKALALWQAVGDKPGTARALALIGKCYMAQNSLPESTQNYERALEIWRDLNNVREQAGVLIMLGFIEHRKGEWSNSIELLTRAQGMLDERAEPYKMGQIAGALGEAFNENGLPEVAVTHFERALDYFRRTQDANAVATILYDLGVTDYLSGRYSEAIAHLKQSLDTVEEDILEATCYEYLGRVYLATGQYDLALQNLHSALDAYTKAVNPKEAARTLGLLGQLAEQRGQLSRARQYYRQALESFTGLSDRLNQAAIYYALGRLELREKNYDVAAKYLKQSIDVTENIRRVSTIWDLTAAFSATVYERYEKYIECLMRQHEARPEEGLAVRAFETSELARARSLAELLRATQTNLVPGLDPQLAAREKSLRQSLHMKEDVKIALLGRAHKAEELDALEAEQSRLEAEYKQVSETIRAQYPSYGQLTWPAAWSLRRIQEEVVADDQTVLLEYSLGVDKSYVWVVTRGDFKSYELPAQAQVNEAAQKVYKSLAAVPGTEDADELTPATQELSRLVLSPVVTELNKPRIIIVADGALNYIPFQVLPIRPADNEPLVARYEIINAPSASVLGELQQEAARRQPAAKVLAAFGSPVFESNYALRKGTGSGEQLAALQAQERGPLQYALRDMELNGDTYDPSALKPLFYAKRELANLRDIAGGETFVATDFAASREQLLRTDLTQYAILHFATHGFLNPKRPEFSGLVLSTVNPQGQTQNGFVGLQDIYNLRAPVSLVVLSACSTALGKEVRGEGLLGLTRGFMYAGASGVLASLWKVDDAATAELMRRFYDNLLHKGMPPAAALRAAQNSIRQEPNWQSPYYWAAFTLQGDYRQVIRSTPEAGTPIYPKIIVGGILCALLTGVGWWYRRHGSKRIAPRR